MPAPGEPNAPVVQPAFGPTLPALLRTRFGLTQRASVLAVAALVVTVVVAGLVIAIRDRNTKLVHRGDPFTFNVVITPELRERPERGDELLRVSGRAGGAISEVTVTPLRIPAFGPATGSAYLPVYADAYIAARRRELEGFELIEEGRQRRDDIPGHQVVYRSTSGGREVIWRDALLIPEKPGARDGVVLRLRQEHLRPRIGPRGDTLVKAGRRAFRSFAPGTKRP